MGHQEPDHGARPGIRAGPPARLRHLFDARVRSGQVHHRNRRHRWRIHHRRDLDPDPQHHRAGRQSGAGRIGHPGPRHGGKHRTNWARSSPRPSPRRWPNTACRSRNSMSRTSACRKRWKRRWTSAPRWGGGRSEPLHAVQCRRSHGQPPQRHGADDGGRHGRGMGAAMGQSIGPWGAAAAPAPPHHRPRPPSTPPRRRRHPRRKPGISPRNGATTGPFGEADLQRWRLRRADARDDGLDRRAGRLEAGRRNRASPLLAQVRPPRPLFPDLHCARHGRRDDARYHWTPANNAGRNCAMRPARPNWSATIAAMCSRSPQAGSPPAPRALVEHDLPAGLRDDLPERRHGRGPHHHLHLLRRADRDPQGATHATECPFCASPVVLDTGAQRVIKPQALVPFVLTEGQAREAMVAGWAACGSRPEHAAGICPQGPGDERCLCAVLDLRRRHPLSAIPGSAANTTTKPAPSPVNGERSQGAAAGTGPQDPLAFRPRAASRAISTMCW
jgi:hypothetical protein